MSEVLDPIAELLAIVLSGRADPFVDVALSDTPTAVTAELARVREALASIAFAESPVEPSPDLRARIMRTLARRSRVPRRAILVLDMQNDHLIPGGPLEVPRARDIVPALAARLDAARAEHVPVVYLVDEHEPDDSDLNEWGAHNIRGTLGAQVFAPLAARRGDRIVSKVTYSGFSRSSLGRVLGELGVDTLILTGCLTEIGLLATATDALQRGYAIEIPPETQAGATELHERVTLAVLGLLPPYGPARDALLAAMDA